MNLLSPQNTEGWYCLAYDHNICKTQLGRYLRIPALRKILVLRDHRKRPGSGIFCPFPSLSPDLKTRNGMSREVANNCQARTKSRNADREIMRKWNVRKSHSGTDKRIRADWPAENENTSQPLSQLLVYVDMGSGQNCTYFTALSAFEVPYLVLQIARH